jgi:hypothetical protein
MLKKPSKYQKRLEKLRRQAQGGSTKAMEQLYSKCHINQIMINGELVDLKRRFADSPSRS